MRAYDSSHGLQATVSVVIPCFNEARTIRSCIESVMSSSGDNIWLQIVAVDGGSEDGTMEILSEMQQECEALSVLHNEAKITPVGLNMGIKASMGEFILVLGAHTTICSDYVEILVKDLRTTLPRPVQEGCQYPSLARPCFSRLPATLGKADLESGVLTLGSVHVPNGT